MFWIVRWDYNVQFYVSNTIMPVKTPDTVLRATNTCYQNFVGPVFPVNMVAQFFEYTWWPSFPVHMGGVITFSGTYWWQIARNLPHHRFPQPVHG